MIVHSKLKFCHHTLPHLLNENCSKEILNHFSYEFQCRIWTFVLVIITLWHLPTSNIFKLIAISKAYRKYAPCCHGYAAGNTLEHFDVRNKHHFITHCTVITITAVSLKRAICRSPSKKTDKNGHCHSRQSQLSIFIFMH